MSMFSAAGILWQPWHGHIVPQTATMNPAPAFKREFTNGEGEPIGAPSSFISWKMSIAALAMQTARSLSPILQWFSIPSKP